MTDYSYSFHGQGNDGLADNVPGSSPQSLQGLSPQYLQGLFSQYLQGLSPQYLQGLSPHNLPPQSGNPTEGVEDSQRTE